MKQALAVINALIEQAYIDLETAMRKWDEKETDGANETEYGNVKFAYGKIVALEEAKKKIREN